MKVLFCTNTFEHVVNGPSRFAGHLLELNRLFPDIEIRILTEDIAVSSTHAGRDCVFRLDLKLNRWTRPWGFIYRMFPYYNACKMVGETFPFDILIFNNAITGIWSAIKLKTPVLGMINDDNSILVNSKDFEGSRKWFRQLVFSCLEKLACSLEQGILVNSRYLHDLVLKNYKPDSAKLHLLYKGVSIHTVPDFKLHHFQTPCKILFVKSDYTRGGLSDLITALSLLDHYQFELQIAGPHPAYKQTILNLNKCSHVHINFIGPADPAAVQDLMKESDLFIVPSHQEALGVANLEAMACGITVISTRAGGIPEVLDRGNNGWMVSPKRPEELADVIQYAIENAAERLQKQKNAYAYVCRHFSQTQVLSRLAEILDHYKA